jgi:hypothetical protein
MVALAYETRTYNGRKVVPLYRPDMAIELPVNLAPSTVFGRGTVIAEITSAANDVQTLTVTGTPTGGSLTIQVTDPLTGALGSYILPYNSSAGAAQTLIRAVLGANITVTGGALPGTPLVFTASGSFVGLPLAPQTILTNGLTGGTTPAGAFVHTTTGRTKGTYGPITTAVRAGSTSPRPSSATIVRPTPAASSRSACSPEAATTRKHSPMLRHGSRAISIRRI